jgi:hypothetical protein
LENLLHALSMHCNLEANAGNDLTLAVVVLLGQLATTADALDLVAFTGITGHSLRR